METSSLKGYQAYFNFSLGGDNCVGREFVATERTFGGYRIANIPLHVRNVSYGDVVKIDEATGEILSCVRRSTYRNGLLHFSDAADPEGEDRFTRVTTQFAAYGILAEVCLPGLASVAVPATVSNKQFHRLVRRTPEELNAYVVPELSVRKNV